MGLVATSEGNFNIAFDRQLGEHILFKDKNAKHRQKFAPTVNRALFYGYDSAVLLADEWPRCTRIVRLYFETTFDIYEAQNDTLHGEVAVFSYVYSLFNQVALLYSNEGVYTEFSTIYIWNTPDPYTASTTDTMLRQFQNERTNFDGDLGMLLTFKDLSSGTGYLEGLAAGFYGLCNPDTAQRLAVSQIANVDTFPYVPIYSESVLVVTHEFGHLLGSVHTHNCYWIVDGVPNSPIDGCGEPEPEDFCTWSGPPVPGGGMGTIMSYCDMNMPPQSGYRFHFRFWSAARQCNKG